MITALTTTVNSIKNDVTDLKTSKSSASSIRKDLEDEIENRKIANIRHEEDSMKIKLLTAMVIKQGEQIQELSAQVDSLQRFTRKANIIISGILEVGEEDVDRCKELVKDFLKEEMLIENEVEIKQAYRFGSGNPRALMVVLSNPDDKSVIFSHVSNLKGKTNARRKLYFVSEDVAELEKENKRYYQQLLKENAERTGR